MSVYQKELLAKGIKGNRMAQSYLKNSCRFMNFELDGVDILLPVSTSNHRVWEKEKIEFLVNVLQDSLKHYDFFPKTMKVNSVGSMANKKGSVYLMKADNGVYKIGMSVNPVQRMLSLERTLPYDLELIHTIPSNRMKHLERYFHDLFKESRLKGEWFELTHEQVEQFKIYKEE